MTIKALLFREPFSFLFRKLWQHAHSDRKKIVCYVTLSFIASAIVLLEPLFFGGLIGEVAKNGATRENFHILILWSFGMLMVPIFFWVFHVPARWYERRIAMRASINYQTYLMQSLLSRGLMWHQDRDSGNILDRYNKARFALWSFSDGSFMTIQAVVRILGTTGILLYFDVSLALVALVVVSVIFWITTRFDAIIVKYIQSLNESLNVISGKIFDVLSNITSIKILHIESIVDSALKHSFQSPIIHKQGEIKYTEIKWSVGDILFRFFAVVALLIFLWLALSRGEIVSVTLVSVLFLYLSQLVFAFYNFSSVYAEILRYKVDVMNAEEFDTSYRDKNIAGGTLPLPPIKSLRIEKIHFAYNEHASLSVDLLDLGTAKRIALVGESGSGKTTFLKLLHGLFDTVEGVIIVNDRKHKTPWDLGSMLVPQEPELFSASIRENITFGVDMDEKLIQQSIDLAQFRQTLTRLPKWLDSVVNEKGVNLSGGEKQRLALVRALVFAHEKQLLLLDESTSSVDSINEGKIYRNIFAQFQDTVIIATIHKMHLLELFDSIVYFSEGKVSDSGTLEELLQRSTEFRELYEQSVQKKK